MKTLLARSILLALCAPALAFAAEPEDLDTVQIVTTKLPLALRDGVVAASVVTGDDLRARGATDLRSALALVSGVDVAPGGDGGPASSVPAMQGLREFDAFLLLIDGVPAGGAFTPALSTMSLLNVDRIEIVKGAAPVSYGATSFVGVIHVIHRAAGEGPREVMVGASSESGYRFGLSLPITTDGAWKQSLTLDAERQSTGADRTSWRRGHAFYRGAGEVAGGDLTLDIEFTQVGQDPNSPRVREGRFLTTRVPIDANHNPGDATIDETRSQISAGYTRETGLGRWDSRLALAHTDGTIIRGFLREGFATNGTTINADGYHQERSTDEVYFDTHLTTALNDTSRLIWGLDYMGGHGRQHSDLFEYAVRGDGRNAPYGRSRPVDEFTFLGDERDFLGLYADLLLQPTDRWSVEAGLRFNHVSETRRTRENHAPAVKDSRSEGRWSGALGTSYRIWDDGSDYLTAFASYRRTFKPAVVDFGPEAEPDILKPETATTYEIGVRGGLFDGRVDWELSAFRTDFRNVVVTQDVGGFPGLVNAGAVRFEGAEFEADWRIVDDLLLTGTYAWHDARFGDYVQLFGSTPTQLRGKVMEMSPGHLASIGLQYTPDRGINAYFTQSYADSRYLNKRNTAPVPAYRTVDAGIAWRAEHWELRLDGTNLTDRRDAVAESELGDAQYYLLPGRSTWLTWRRTF
jgi:outer membrane receptor protein involved in Fe transport